MDSIVLFNHNLRYFKIENPEDGLTIFYTKTAENDPWTMTFFDNNDKSEEPVEYDDDTLRALKEKYKITLSSIDIFSEHLGDVGFPKKNDDITFKTIPPKLIENFKEMYNEHFYEIITLQYILKNNLTSVIVEDFDYEIIKDNMNLVDFHKYVFENINIL